MASETKKVARGRPFGSSGKETRERLLQAAAQQFSERDFFEVSMSQIAKAAGLTSSAIYNHYSSKDELFQETVKTIISRNITLMADAATIDGDWQAKIANILDTTQTTDQLGFANPLIISAAQLKMAREPEKFPEIRRLRGEYSAIFQGIVEDAVAQGDFPSDTPVDVMGDLLMALIANGLSAVRVHRPSEVQVRTTIDCFKKLVLARAG